MIVGTEKFVYVTYIAATPERIWRALIDGELTRQYWAHENVSDWKPGADWQLVADDGKRTVHQVGKVQESLPNKRLVVTWANPADAADSSKHSRLAIDIEVAGDMTRLTVTHEQLTPEMYARITTGWPIVMSSLKSFLETGRPFKFWA
jgi:uncharacterized protein YndB with AHSA1/START domain